MANLLEFTLRFKPVLDGLDKFANALKQTLVENKKKADAFNQSISNGDKAIRKWAQGLAALVSVNALRKYAQDALAAEQATGTLNQVLARTGQTGAAKALADQVTELKRVTNFSGEAITSVQRLLITFGLTAEQTRDTTESVLDFASATGQDAASAAQLIGRTLKGESDELGRYGIKLDKTKGKVDALRRALGQLASGAARADVANPQLRALQVRYEDAGQKIGAAVNTTIVPIMERLVPLFERASTAIATFVQQNQSLGRILADMTPAIVQVVAGIGAISLAAKGVLTVINPLRTAFVLFAGTSIASITGMKLAFGSLGAGIATVGASLAAVYAGWKLGEMISELEAGGAKIKSWSAAVSGQIMAFGIEVWGSLRTLWNGAVTTVHTSSLALVSRITGIITTLQIKANDAFQAIAKAYNNTVAKTPGMPKIDLSQAETAWRNLWNKRAEGEADTAAKIRDIRKTAAEENLRIETETEQRASELRQGGLDVLAADLKQTRKPDTAEGTDTATPRPDLNKQGFGDTTDKTAAARALYLLETQILQAELAGNQLRANAIRRYIQEQEALAKLGDDALDLIWDRVEAEEALDAKTRARQTAENTLQDTLFTIDQEIARTEADKFTNEIEKNDKIVTLLEQKNAALRDYKALLQGDLDSGNLDPGIALDTRTKITGIDQDITKNEGETATRTAADPADLGQQLAAKATEAEDALGTAAQRAAQAWSTTADTIRTSMGDAFTDMLWQGKSLHDAMAGFATSIAQSFVGQIAQMAADWIYQHTIMAAWKAITEAKLTAATATGAATRTTIVAGEETAATAAKATGTAARTGFSIMDAGKSIVTAAAGAMAAVASVPYVGPILAVAAVAAILALGAKVLGAFATGGLVRGAGTGTSDNNLIRVSDGEYIVRSAAVDHYGVGMFDALNAGALDLADGVEAIPLPLARSAGGSQTTGGAFAGGSQEEREINLSINLALVGNDMDARAFLESREGRGLIIQINKENRAEFGVRV